MNIHEDGSTKPNKDVELSTPGAKSADILAPRKRNSKFFKDYNF
jgi:hypothetical protein